MATKSYLGLPIITAIDSWRTKLNYGEGEREREVSEKLGKREWRRERENCKLSCEQHNKGTVLNNFLWQVWYNTSLLSNCVCDLQKIWRERERAGETKRWERVSLGERRKMEKMNDYKWIIIFSSALFVQKSVTVTLSECWEWNILYFVPSKLNQ